MMADNSQRLVACAERIRIALLKEPRTIATAESLTAGLVSNTLAAVSGSSVYLRGGIVAYHIDAKVGLLGVSRELAEQCGCVSETVAIQMAQGARRALGADIGLATTGYAEPWPEGHVVTPYAHFCIMLGDRAISTGTVTGTREDGTLLDRRAMQAEVTFHLLSQLVLMLGG